MVQHLVVETSGGSTVHALGIYESIGRDHTNSIRLRDPKASKRHCEIERSSEDTDGYIVRDLESVNGTYVNGVRIAGNRPLRHGDRIGVGDTRVHYKTIIGGYTPPNLAYQPPSLMVPAETQEHPTLPLAKAFDKAPSAAPALRNSMLPELEYYPARDPTALKALLLLRSRPQTKANIEQFILREETGDGAPDSEWLKTAASRRVAAALADLEALGLVDNLDGKYRQTARLSLLQNALGISLRRLLWLQTEDNVVCRPIFRSPRPTTPADVFVLMPFAEELERVYKKHVCRAAESLKLSVGRADDFSGTGEVLLDVWSGIYRAKVIVADCTGANPNVFYELGIAHTLGQRVVLIGQDKSNVPFDIGHLRRIQYDMSAEGLQRLEMGLGRALRAALEL